MGLAFADKVQSLINLHSDGNWHELATLVTTIRQQKPAGFYTTDDDGNRVPVTENSISKAVSDLVWWQLLEEDRGRTRQPPSSRIRVRHYAKDLGNALADVLAEKTMNWTKKTPSGPKALDVSGIIETLRTIPPPVIPTRVQLYDELSRIRPDIFSSKALGAHRFGQLLGMLGDGGMKVITSIRTQIHLLADDPRVAQLRPD